MVAHPARAQNATPAACESWLCLPAGFPGPHCTPALYALESRLRAHIDPIPAWPLCATLYDGPPADLAAWMGDVYLSCHGNDRQEGGLCLPVLGAIYPA